MDAKLFLNKELDGNLKASSKSKYASDFISLGEQAASLLKILDLFVPY